MSELEDLLKFYKANKDRIRSFIDTCDYDGDECLFGELCFCILTPQSRAKRCRDVVNMLKADKKLFTANRKELISYLKGVRFHNTKAGRIIEARRKLPELKRMLGSSSPGVLREWLMANINGLGMKESSHFMRNIGFRGLPIIDVHIINFLKKIGCYEETGSLTKKKYQGLEKRFLQLSKNVKIPVEELDIAIWLYQSKEENFYG